MKRSDRIRLGVCASTGQTAIEYLALLAVVLAVVGAIVATGIGDSLSRSAQDQVCRIGPAGFVAVDCSDDNDVETVRAAEPDTSGSAGPVDDGAGEPLGVMLDEPVRKSVELPPGSEPNALPDLCFEPRESNSSVKVPGSGVLGNTAAWGYSWLVNLVIDKIDNEKNKEKRVKLALDDLAYCLPEYNIVIAQPHEGNLQEMDGTALIETVRISGTTYRVYAFRTGKFTWAEDADLGWKNRAFHGVFDVSEDRRTVTFREPPDRSRYYNTYSPLDDEGSTQAVRMLVNDMRRCFPDYNVVAMHSEQDSHWVEEPGSFVHQGRYRLNSGEHHEDEHGDDIASGRAVFDVHVFDKGTFRNEGDGGYTNWAMYGNFERDGMEAIFDRPAPADLDADSTPTGSGTVHLDDGTPKYTGGGPYPGTDYSGKVPGGKAELTHSLLDAYGRSFPGKNIITARSFDDLSFSGVSGLEHLAVVDGVDVFAVDSGTITNRGDGGWKNWGFAGDFDYAEDAKAVTFSHR